MDTRASYDARPNPEQPAPAPGDAEPSTLAHEESAATPTGMYVPTDLAALVGDLPVLDGYEVLGVVAHGGMGYVLRARDTTLRRTVAVKLPLGPLGAEGRERFVREARAAAALRHPNICQIHRVDVTADGTPFIVMEYLAGRTLRADLRAGLPSPRAAAAILAPVARAVAFAHDAGVIHRDLKPQNVIVVDATGQPVLTDFGLAKAAGDDESELTRTGQVMGTPAYMAPEQAAGHTEKVGPRSDVYGLGAILYQLLTGEAPFTGPAGEVVKKVQTDEPVAPRKRVPTVHPDIETVCLKCLAKDPAERYQSAADLAADLERFAGGEPVLARRPGLGRRAGRWARRNRAALAAAVLVVAAGVAAAVAANRAADRSFATNVRGEIDARLNQLKSADWTADDLRELDTLADQLEARDAERGAAARRDIADALYESGRSRLPRFDDADRRYAVAVVTLLRPRDPAAADRLDAAARARRRDWVPVFRIAAPDLPPADVVDRTRAGAVSLHPAGLLFGTVGGSKERPTHLAAVKCDGNVQIEARLAPGWENLERVGVVVNVPADSDAGGYGAEVRPGREGTRVVVLTRAGRVVREGGLPPVIRGGPVTLTLQREGDQVRAQVNVAPPVVFRDLFPLPGGGVYGLVGWPVAIVETVEGRRQAAAPAATPLEQGTDRYLAGDYAGALAVYQKAAVDRAGTPEAAEARFRAALCLVELARYDEAADRLRELYEAGVPTWSPLAGCYLVVAQVRRKDVPGAMQLLDRLLVEFAAAGTTDLTTRLPDDVRNEILGAYRTAAQGVSLIRDDPDRVAKVDRLLRAEEALGTAAVYVGFTRLAMIRALRSSSAPAARPEAVRRLGEWLTRDYPPGHDATPYGHLLAAEFSWLMRESGTPGKAFDALNLRLPPDPSGYPVLVERARVWVALGEPAKAEQDLNAFFAAGATGGLGSRHVADAALMLGLLREKRGDAAGARAAWAAGVPALSPADPNFQQEVGGGIGVLTVLALRLLTDTLDDTAFEQMVRNLATRVPGSELVFLVLGSDDLRALGARMRAALGRPEAREQLWKFAFQTLPFPEYAREPVLFAAREVAREGAFAAAPTPEQEGVLAAAAAGLYRAAAEGRVSGQQMVRLGLTAKGGLLASTTPDPSLPAELRGPVGYLLGCRYQRLGRPGVAVGFFREAAAAAPAGTPVRALAEAELTRAGAKP